jgi:phosphoketolase
MDQATNQCGWAVANNDKGGEPDVVMACCRDVLTLETLAAVDLVRRHAHYLKVDDVIEQAPKLEERAVYFRQAIREKVIAHWHYFAKHGDELPEVRDWNWPGGATACRTDDTCAEV